MISAGVGERTRAPCRLWATNLRAHRPPGASAQNLFGIEPPLESVGRG
jgi:hypothetical protein